MESSHKILTALLIFCPAFFYFLYAINRDDGLPRRPFFQPSKEDLIFHSQSLSTKIRKDVYRLSTKNNQNWLMQEANGNMVKVRFGQKEYDALKKFENIHHPDIWKWIMDKVGRSDNLDILDVSEECAVFALMLAEKYSTNKLTCMIRGEAPDAPLPPNVKIEKVDFKHKSFQQFEPLGQFDVVIVNELTHEVPELGQFFKVLKAHLKPGAPLVILSRPKNPPLPVPESCLLLWRKLMPTKEEITAASNYAEMGYTTFSAAVPISVDRYQWESMLYSGCFPAVKGTLKCNEKDIRDFCNNQSPKINFEEKMSIYLLKE